MSFKLVNPGFADILTVEDGVTIETTKYSRTGYAFYRPRPGSYAQPTMKLPEVMKKFYCKFDIYFPTTNSIRSPMQLKISDRDGISISHGSSTNWASIYVYLNSSTAISVSNTNSNAKMLEQNTGLIADAVNSIYFEIIPGESCALWVNNRLIKSEQKNYRDLTQTTEVYFENASDYPISNMIISDEPFDRHERIVFLPVSAVTTDMERSEDGIYTANVSGQSVLQVLDTTALSKEYGKDSKVTGLGILGRSASCTAEGLTSLTAIQKQGSVITEYGTQTLNEKAKNIFDYHALDMSIAELNGLQAGWKAGE